MMHLYQETYVETESTNGHLLCTYTMIQGCLGLTSSQT